MKGLHSAAQQPKHTSAGSSELHSVSGGRMTAAPCATAETYKRKITPMAIGIRSHPASGWVDLIQGQILEQ